MFLLPQTMQAILDEHPLPSGHSVTAAAVARLEQRFGMTASQSHNARLLADALSDALTDPYTRSLLDGRHRPGQP